MQVNKKLIEISKHSISNNLGWLLLERFTRLFFGLIVGAWVARYLGPSNYGQLVYFLTFMALFSSFASLGLDSIAVRECAKQPEKSKEIIYQVLYMRIISGLISWIMLILYVAYSEGVGTLLWISIIVGATFAFQASETFDLWFQAAGKNKIAVKTKLIAFVISNGFKIILIEFQFDLIYFILMVLIEAIITALILLNVFIKETGSQKVIFLTNQMKLYLKESWPYLISNISILIYTRIDQVYIKNIIGDYALGQYAVGIVFSQFWYFLPVMLINVAGPYIARAKIEGDNEYQRKLMLTFRVFLALGLSITIITYILSSFMVLTLYGEKYVMAAEILKIHSITIVFVFMGVAQNLWIINESKGNMYLYKTVIGMSISVLGNSLLLPTYGVIGAAYTAVLAQSVATFFSNIIMAPKIFLMQLGLSRK